MCANEALTTTESDHMREQHSSKFNVSVSVELHVTNFMIIQELLVSWHSCDRFQTFNLKSRRENIPMFCR